MHAFTIICVLRGLEGGVFTIIRVLRGSEGRFTIIRVLRGLDVGSAVAGRRSGVPWRYCPAHVNNTNEATSSGFAEGERWLSKLDVVYPPIGSLRLRKLSI